MLAMLEMPTAYRRLYAMLGRVQQSPPMKPKPAPRVIVPIPKTLLKRIDDFRWQNRIPSRAETIRTLIKAGLEAKQPKPT